MMKFEYTRLSDSASKLAADMIDPNEVDLYLEEGFDSPEYIDTLKSLYRVRSFFKELEKDLEDMNDTDMISAADLKRRIEEYNAVNRDLFND